MELNTSLSSEQASFALWLEGNIPYLLPLFDFPKRELSTAKLEQYLSVASEGEQIMARFVASVWLGENTYEFNIIDAARTLDKKQRSIVADWLKNPLWP